MAWGHHHTDDGSIQFYARGYALVVDSAFSQPQERGERKFLTPGHSRPVPEGLEPLTHLWRFNRGWVLDSRIDSELSYAVAGLPLFAAVPHNLPPTPYVRAVWGLRAVVELAPDVYLIADHFDATARQFARFHVPHREVTLDGNRVAASFAKDCHFTIAPLVDVAPPHLSLDRPTNPAKLPQEITTSVEYVAPGKWSVFVLAALGEGEQLVVASGPDEKTVSWGTHAFRVRFAADDLEVTGAREFNRVLLQPATLLRPLRAGSR
jgi:sarcosine oxidase gamma subunit